jgi:hypothetical protein
MDTYLTHGDEALIGLQRRDIVVFAALHTSLNEGGIGDGDGCLFADGTKVLNPPEFQ